MKVAVLILAVFAASASAGLFDGMLSVTLARSYLAAFSTDVGSEITIMLNAFFTAFANVVVILGSVGQNFIVLVTSFGVRSASLVITVTADAAQFAAYLALNFVSITVSNVIVAPYNAVMAAINLQVSADIARLTLLVASGQVKYTCLQSARVYIEGNVTEFRVEVRQKRDDHNQKIKDKSDALSKRIKDDYDGVRKNLTDTCENSHSGSSERGCEVEQYMVLRPEIKEKHRGYVKQARDDADENEKDAKDKAEELRVSFNVRYTKIKADIKECSARA